MQDERVGGITSMTFIYVVPHCSLSQGTRAEAQAGASWRRKQYADSVQLRRPGKFLQRMNSLAKHNSCFESVS